MAAQVVSNSTATTPEGIRRWTALTCQASSKRKTAVWCKINLYQLIRRPFNNRWVQVVLAEAVTMVANWLLQRWIWACESITILRQRLNSPKATLGQTQLTIACRWSVIAKRAPRERKELTPPLMENSQSQWTSTPLHSPTILTITVISWVTIVPQFKFLKVALCLSVLEDDQKHLKERICNLAAVSSRPKWSLEPQQTTIRV